MLEASETEAEWAAVLSIHLIEKLTIARGPVIISDEGHAKNILSICPCGCMQDLEYGDTSIGEFNILNS